MKLVVLSSAVLLSLSIGSAARALEFRAPVAKQLFACEAKNLTRVAHGADRLAGDGAAVAQPGACCQDLRCAQFLATRSVHKPRLDPRT